MIAKKQDKEYGPIHGLPEFTGAAAKLAFGEDSEVIKNSLVCIACWNRFCYILTVFLVGISRNITFTVTVIIMTCP